ncbi:MAG TPA: hypothetical protein VHC69_01655 [Polyangiaceae bacterium]|nr:hypothetical protein [Polyangiaceae bacterium]
MSRGDATDRCGRRGALSWLGAAAVSAILLSPRLARAGSYLDRIGLLVREARGEVDYLEYRLGDKDLAELIHKLATARLAAARDMLIPKEVVQAHPHLLLMLENCERAADAAEAGERMRFVTFQRKARDEEQMFRSIMRQLHFPLEDEKKK